MLELGVPHKCRCSTAQKLAAPLPRLSCRPVCSSQHELLHLHMWALPIPAPSWEDPPAFLHAQSILHPSELVSKPSIAPPKPLSGSLHRSPRFCISTSCLPPSQHMAQLCNDWVPACTPILILRKSKGGLHHGRGGTPSPVNMQWERGDGAAPGPATSVGWLVRRWTGPMGLLGALGSGHCSLSSHLPLVPHQPGPE